MRSRKCAWHHHQSVRNLKNFPLLCVRTSNVAFIFLSLRRPLNSIGIYVNWFYTHICFARSRKCNEYFMKKKKNKECITICESQLDRTGNNQRNFFESSTFTISTMISDNVTYRYWTSDRTMLRANMCITISICVVRLN